MTKSASFIITKCISHKKNRETLAIWKKLLDMKLEWYVEENEYV